MIKLALFAVGFFFLSIFQTSFLVHYSIYGRVLNIILVIVVLYNLFESRDKPQVLDASLLFGLSDHCILLFLPLFNLAFDKIPVAFLIMQNEK